VGGHFGVRLSGLSLQENHNGNNALPIFRYILVSLFPLVLVFTNPPPVIDSKASSLLAHFDLPVLPGAPELGKLHPEL